MEIKKLLVISKIEIEKNCVTLHLDSGKVAGEDGYGDDLTMMYVAYPLAARTEFNIGDKMEALVRPFQAR